jgi:hypothetical protein
MNHTLLPLGLLLAAACSAPRPAAPSSGSQSPLTAEIAAAEQAWARGIIAADTVTLTRLLAPEFVLVGPDTTEPPFPRAAWMTNVGSRRVYTDSVVIDSLRVTGTADSALATLHYWWRPIMNGQRMPPDPTRLLDTWVRRDGRWQVVERRRLDARPARP